MINNVNIFNQLLLINHETVSAVDISLCYSSISQKSSSQNYILSSISQKSFIQSGMLDWFTTKLCQNGICGDLINTLIDILINRKYMVVLKDQCSS